jgi:predicted TPR repeat methyltransferase
LFEKAIYAIQAGSFDTATATYFRILAFDPENIKARLRMCELSILLRESDTALNYCGEVTQRAPTWADGWYQLGREHYLRGDFPQAQQALYRCAMLQSLQDIPIRERTLDCWRLQGTVAELQGDCDALIQAYEEYQWMVMIGGLRQTWTYPPEGPAICASPTEVEFG